MATPGSLMEHSICVTPASKGTVSRLGFGSPLGEVQPSHGQVLGAAGSEKGRVGPPRSDSKENACSPLLFRRTPGGDMPTPDSTQRFSSWVQATSPYTDGKASRVGAGEAMEEGGQGCTQGGLSPGAEAHFQRWLSATGGATWTPSSSVGAPTPAHASTPAVTPASAPPQSRPLLDLCGGDTDGGDSSDEDEKEEEVGGGAGRAAPAPGAARVRGFGSSGGSTIYTTPGPGSRAQAQQLAAASLSTPLCMMSLGSCPRRADTHTPGAPPPSPAEQVINLMLAPASPELQPLRLARSPTAGAGEGAADETCTPPQRRQHRLHHSAGAEQPPPSPEQQLLQLMIQPAAEEAAAAEEEGQAQGQDGWAGNAEGAGEQFADAESDQWESGDEGTGDEDSGDDMDYDIVASLLSHESQESSRTGMHMTPISDIIGMMLTPGSRQGLSPHDGEAGGDHDGPARPRELFADE